MGRVGSDERVEERGEEEGWRKKEGEGGAVSFSLLWLLVLLFIASRAGGQAALLFCVYA